MNKQLYQSYKSLTETEQAELRHKHKDSPVGLRLVEFLSAYDKPDFKTVDAVAIIYKEDVAEEYSVLENRYFKLRKKIYDEVQKIQADKGGRITLPEEEDVLNHCKEMIAVGDKKEAYKLLTELEKTCWERNVFELLPSILDNMIFCNQAANDTEKNKPLYPSLERAIELEYDLNRAIMAIRKIYEITISRGPQYAKALMLTLKELGTKNSKYPRFIMFYHYVSLSYKLSSMDYTRNMQVISRHLAEFKKLYSKHPLIPMVIYKANHAKVFHYQFAQINAFIHNNRLEFEEAYEAMNEMWTMANSSDSLFRSYMGDSLYFNLFTLQCLTKRYKGAFDTCELFAAFLKKEKRLERMPFVNMMRSVLYVTAYPHTYKMDASYLHGQIDEYLKLVKKVRNTQLPFEQAVVFKAEMHLLQGENKLAITLLKDKEIQTYLQVYNVCDVFNELIEILNSKAIEKIKRMKELEKKVQQRRYKATRIDELVPLNWIVAYLEQALKETL